MVRVGVTGALGFVGTHLMVALREAGHRAIAIEGDIAEPLIPGEPIDALVHAAAVHPSETVQSLIRNNAVGTARMVAYARMANVRTFIYFSTISVYGTISESVVDERTPVHNPGTYGMTKWLGEMAVLEGAFRSLSIRPCGIIGKGASRNWLSRVLRAAQSGYEIQLSNPDAPFNNAVHVSDLCQLIIGAIEDSIWSGHDAVTLGAGGSITVAEAVGLLVEATGKKSAIRVCPKPSPTFIVSSDRARARYIYRPMSIEAMLVRYAGESA